MASLAGVAATAAIILGGIALVSGIGHWVAVTTKAVAEGRGYDVRLADMLAIGFLPVSLGAAMIGGGWLAGHDPRLGLTVAASAATLFTLVLLLLWPALTTGPEGSLPGTALGLAAFAAEAVLAWLAR